MILARVVSAAFVLAVGGREGLMFIEIKELELHPIDFEEEFRPGIIDFGADLRQKSSLRASLWHGRRY